MKIKKQHWSVTVQLGTDAPTVTVPVHFVGTGIFDGMELLAVTSAYYCACCNAQTTPSHYTAIAVKSSSEALRGIERILEANILDLCDANAKAICEYWEGFNKYEVISMTE
jgi:hypothetical protein